MHLQPTLFTILPLTSLSISLNRFHSLNYAYDGTGEILHFRLLSDKVYQGMSGGKKCRSSGLFIVTRLEAVGSGEFDFLSRSACRCLLIVVVG
jgi:hypothetical protein